MILPAAASRDEWTHTRTLGIGGSDVAAACGLSPWRTPYQLWLEKTGRVDSEPDSAGAERMHWGTLLEPVLLREWDDRNPAYVLTGGDGVYSDPEHPWMLANVDGLAWTSRQELAGVVEVKTGSHRSVAGWAEDEVPVHYVTQVQWYMHILGAPRAFLAALLDTSTYVERVIERDDELIGDLIDNAAEFWGHVQRDEPPPVDGTDTTRAMLARVRANAGEVIELDGSWHKHLDHRRELAEQIAVLDAERARLDNELRAAMGTAEVATIDGQKVASHKAPAKPSRTCAYDDLAADHPELYAQYVTEKTPTRRLVYAPTNTVRRD